MDKASKDIGLLILRLSAGGLMLVHGLPKLMKLFAYGPIQFADPFGIGATTSLILAVFAEVVCAILLILGLKTKLASIPLAVTMFVAAFMIHASDPFKVKEKAILFLLMYISLMFTGAGKFSVDDKL